MHIDELKAALEPKRPLEKVGNYSVLLLALGFLVFLCTYSKVGDEPSTIVGPFGKWLVLYGLFACGVILVFTYPVGRFNDMAEDERKRRFKFAPYATYELDSQNLARITETNSRCCVCEGMDSLWWDIDRGSVPLFRLCDDCSKELNLIKGVSLRSRITVYPLARTTSISACALLLAASMHLPQAVLILVRILVCGTAAACFAFRCIRVDKDREVEASLEIVIWIAIIIIFFVPLPLQASTWRFADIFTGVAFLVAAKTRRYLFGETMGYEFARREREAAYESEG